MDSLLCRSLDQVPFVVKARSMARTVPGLFIRIPCQLASEMRTHDIHLIDFLVLCLIYSRLACLRLHDRAMPRLQLADVSSGIWKKRLVSPFTAFPLSFMICGISSAENLDGANTSAQGFSDPQIISLMIIADTIDEVIPHF